MRIKLQLFILLSVMAFAVVLDRFVPSLTMVEVIAISALAIGITAFVNTVVDED